jgi:DNA polymerase I-like protein with 3'-5' exonuclease and polymerase domains
MDILVCDFETFYDKSYSLSSITTEEYIRHELFETIGVAVKRNDEETQWFSGTKAQTKRWLEQWDWGNSIAVAHNAMFDMAILNWHFDIRPKRIADTLAMSRALHGTEVGGSLKAMAEYYEIGEKGTEVLNALGKGRIDFTDEELERYGQYCVNDVELTYELFKRMAASFPPSELKLVDLTTRMFTEPVLRLDVAGLETHLADVQRRKTRLLDKALVDKDQIMSNPKLAQLLNMLNVAVPMKVSPTTGKETYAFAKNDEAFKALLEHENPIVQAIVSARLGVKSTLEETRTERFIEIGKRGTLPVPLRYYGAHTGRWSGEDKINLQNLPRGSALKKAVLAPEGHVFIDCDSSQIEARTLAWLAGQDDLVAAFDAGEDVYKIMATSIYGVDLDKVTKDQRFVGKTTILGAGYGMGPPKFHAQLKGFNVDPGLEECERVIFVYRATYPMIPALWKQAQAALEAMIRNQTAPLGLDGVLVVEGRNGIRLPNGMRLKYPNLRWVEKDGKREMVYDQKKGRAVMTTRIYGGKLVENICQAVARIVIGEQMLKVAQKLRVVMTVHDAVGVIAPVEQADAAQAYVEQCMRTAPKWAAGLPLNCESKIGASYGG